MSHVKNVECYSRLVDICTGYGGKYNPGHQSLQLKAMRALLNEAKSSLHDVTLKRIAHNSMINKRAEAFAGIEVLANRIVGTLIALQLPKATIDDARFYSRLINGKRATPRIPVPSEDSDGQTIQTRSFSQLSYVARAHNFFRLVQMVREEPAYKTNEASLQIPSLMERAAQLEKLNEEVNLTKVALKLVMLKRDAILYKGKNALVSTATAVRRYVQVVFGYRSGEALQLKEVSFTKIKTR